MGTFSSKAWNDVLEVTHPTTPTQRFRRISTDPRSPSEEIDRTPIQVAQTPKIGGTIEVGDAVESLDDKRKQLKMLKIQNMSSSDPRSPSVNIQRTPAEENFIDNDKENSNNGEKNMPVQRGPKKLFAEKTQVNQLSLTKNDSLRISVQKKEFKKGKEGV